MLGEKTEKNHKFKVTDSAGKIKGKFVVSFLYFSTHSKFLIRSLFSYNCYRHYHHLTFIILLLALR